MPSDFYADQIANLHADIAHADVPGRSVNADRRVRAAVQSTRFAQRDTAGVRAVVAARVGQIDGRGAGCLAQAVVVRGAVAQNRGVVQPGDGFRRGSRSGAGLGARGLAPRRGRPAKVGERSGG